MLVIVSQVEQTVKMTGIQEHKDECSNLKRVCTRFLNQLKKSEQDNSLDRNLLEVLKPKIISRIDQLEGKEMVIDALLNKAKYLMVMLSVNIVMN